MRRIFFVEMLLIAACCIGCGSRHGATVSGKVSLDGQTLPSDSVGSVAFYPVAGGPPATGSIDDDSYYTLRTGREASVPPGEYTVTVGASQRPTQSATSDGGPPPPGKPITPTKYRLPRTSGLQYTVEPGGNTIDLELQSN